MKPQYTHTKMVNDIRKALEQQGYWTSTIHHYRKPVEIMVGKTDHEITVAEVEQVLEYAIPASFMYPRWISENGEVYIQTRKFWNAVEA